MSSLHATTHSCFSPPHIITELSDAYRAAQARLRAQHDIAFAVLPIRREDPAMNLHQTWRRILRRLGEKHHRPSPAAADVDLIALSEAFVANDAALRRMLEADGRDTWDIPGFDVLADQQGELARRIADTPARSSSGLIAKARCARLHPAERGFDAAHRISLSLADDFARISGLSPSSSSLFCSSPDAAPRQMKEQIMNIKSDADRRLAVLRRNESWRQLTQALGMIGAFALCALVGLPLNGVALSWIGCVVLLATGIGAIGLSFFLLRFIDHRE